jgi:hypothetical protein
MAKAPFELRGINVRPQKRHFVFERTSSNRLPFSARDATMRIFRSQAAN